MTPVQMEVVLHYFFKAEPFPRPTLASKDAEEKLKAAGLLNHVTLTERGNAYVAMLKAVPLPVCKWVAP